MYFIFLINDVPLDVVRLPLINTPSINNSQNLIYENTIYDKSVFPIDNTPEVPSDGLRVCIKLISFVLYYTYNDKILINEIREYSTILEIHATIK
jgi:hypothetical protein